MQSCREIRTLPGKGRGLVWSSGLSAPLLRGDTAEPNPQLNPQPVIRRMHPHGVKKFTLRRPDLFAVEMECRLSLAVTQDAG